MKLSESSDRARHLLPFSMSKGGKLQRYLLCRIVLFKGVDYRSFNIAPIGLYNFNFTQVYYDDYFALYFIWYVKLFNLN